MSSVSAFVTPAKTGNSKSDEVYSYLNTHVHNPKNSVLPYGAYFTRDVPAPLPLAETTVSAAWDRRGGVVL